MGTIGLAKALAMLRSELAQAQSKATGISSGSRSPRPRPSSSSRSTQRAARRPEAASGVVTLKAGGKVSRADTHRLILKLRITDQATGGRNLEVNRGETRNWDQ